MENSNNKEQKLSEIEIVSTFDKDLDLSQAH